MSEGRGYRVVRHRRLLHLAFISLSLVVLITGCTQTPSTPRAKTSTDTLRFGPVYPVSRLSDPLLAKTVREDARDPFHLRSRIAKTSAVAGSAEIRGYLVDWIVPLERGRVLFEYAVMKDGSLFTVPYHRPAAAFGRAPPARLTPEPRAEAKARESAVKAASAVVARQDARLTPARAVVYNYLVRIHRRDGSSSDVWVDPDANAGRFFYKIRLRAVDERSGAKKPSKRMPRAKPAGGQDGE